VLLKVVLWVLAGLVGLIGLVALVLYLARVSIRVRLKDKEWRVTLKVFWLERTHYPAPPSSKEKKPGEKEPPKAKKEKKSPSQVDQVQLFLSIAEDIKKALGKMFDAIRIDRLEMDLIVATGDPARTGIAYGAAAAAVGMAVPALESAFRVKEKRISVEADFERTEPVTLLNGVFAVRLLPLVLAAASAGSAFLRANRKMKKQNQKEKAV